MILARIRAPQEILSYFSEHIYILVVFHLRHKNYTNLHKHSGLSDDNKLIEITSTRRKKQLPAIFLQLGKEIQLKICSGFASFGAFL